MATDRRTQSRAQPSMADVAAHAGVALGTVSNTLNSPAKVTEATRRKVLASIAELGFVRNDAARFLAAGTSTAVGLVVADLGNSFFVDIARGAEKVMRRQGMNVLIVNSDIDPDREVRNLQLFEQARVAGIILAPLDTPLIRSERLPLQSTPTVLVNFESPSHAYAGVVVNERHGGALAARHLLDLGRRRLLFAGGPLFLGAVKDRYDGAFAAVRELPDASLDVLETRGLQIRHGRQLAEEILAVGPGRYDGIIAAADLLAIGLIETLSQTEGFRVPDDVAITGYDNNHFASDSAIPVTTVSQPGEEMGSAAADLLLDQIAHPESPRETVTLEPHLIPRRSSLGDIWQRD
jgi:LacI family transcriptional regulator